MQHHLNIQDNSSLQLIYEKLVQKISDTVMITEAENIEAPDGPKILYVNDAFTKMSGYSSTEVIGKTPRILQGPKTDKQELKRIKQALQNFESVKSTLINYSKQGEEYYVELEIIPVAFEDKQEKYFISIERDITQQKLFQEAIIKTHELNKKLFESSPDCLKLLDKEGNLEHMNVNGCNLMEIDDFNFVKHKKWTDLWPQEAKPAVQTAVDKAMNGENHHFQAFCPTAKGTAKWWDVLVCPVLNDANEVFEIISSSRDITNYKLEEQRKTDFLKMVSHEVRTPITSIKGYVQLLQMELKANNSPSPSINFALERIDNQINRINKLINEILDVSRLETGNMVFNKEIFSLNKLLQETVADLSLTNSSRKIIILQNDVCQIDGDKNKIEQVFINLINNAIKFSPENAIIEISCKIENKQVCVSIKDYGIGIKETDKENLFKLFYRVEETAKNYKGFGIGLYLVKEIMNLHNGDITIESEYGKGSKFILQFPIYHEIS